MAYAKKIQTLTNDGNGWVNGPDVVVTKNSIAAAVEPDSAVGKTAVRLNDGTSIRVNQTIDQILAFLNS